MELKTGANVWIPCEVLRGRFSDKRSVRMESPEGRWAGFVDPNLLRDDIAEGRTAVRATIVELNDSVVSARLPGQTPHSRYLTCSATWIRGLIEA